MDRSIGIDAIVRAVGLPNHELAWLLESEIEKCYLARGTRVRANVSLEHSPHVQVVALREDADDAASAPHVIAEPLQPDPAALAISARQYRDRHTDAWAVARATCLDRRSDHSIVLLADHPDFADQTAFLPHTWLAPNDRDRWGEGAIRYVALRNVDQFADEPEALHARGAAVPWIATRRHSAFLRSLVFKFWNQTVRAHVAGELGLLVVAPHEAIGDLVGPNGAYARLLADVAGLASIVVVREPAAADPGRRIDSAIRQIAGVATFERVAPADPHAPLWTIRANAADCRRLAANRGARLTLIARLSGVKVRLEQEP